MEHLVEAPAIVAQGPRTGKRQAKAATAEDRLRAEIRKLRRKVKALRDDLEAARLATAQTTLHARRLRSKRAHAYAKERSHLELQLTQLVQEIGQLRHLPERCQKLEAELRARESNPLEAASEV